MVIVSHGLQFLILIRMLLLFTVPRSIISQHCLRSACLCSKITNGQSTIPYITLENIYMKIYNKSI
jgi:hypothetical protein